MKKLFFLLSIVLPLSCSDSDDVDVNQLEVGFPQRWVITKDVSDPTLESYSYLYTNLSVMYRDEIQKSYPLKDLTDEENCLFYVAKSTSSDGKSCFTIQLDSDKSRTLTVGQSSNKQEVHLQITKGADLNDPEDGDLYKFFLHRMEDVEGVSTYAIESVGMPGWYISDSPPGFNYAANVVTLQSETKPENAPKWQGRIML